jgi:plastocyanin
MIRRLSLAAIVALTAALIPVGSAGAGSTCHVAPTPFDARTRVVPMKNLCFAPVVVRVPRGASVTWVNADGYKAPHTVTGVGTQWGSYDELLPGDRVRYRFERDGVFPYFCVIHPGMSGAVVVGDGIGDGSAAPASLVPTGNEGAGGSGGGERAAGATATEPAAWPWVAALVAGSGLALAWSQRRRPRGAEKPAS